MRVEYSKRLGDLVLDYYKGYDSLTVYVGDSYPDEQVLSSFKYYVMKARESKLKYIMVQLIEPNTIRLYSLYDFMIDMSNDINRRVLVNAYTGLGLLEKLIKLEHELDIWLGDYISKVYDNIDEYKKLDNGATINEYLNQNYYYKTDNYLVKINDILDILDFNWEPVEWNSDKFKPVLNKEGKIIGVAKYNVIMTFDEVNVNIEEHKELAELLDGCKDMIVEEYKDVVEKFIEEEKLWENRYEMAKGFIKSLGMSEE